jgi:hypothetical protein
MEQIRISQLPIASNSEINGDVEFVINTTSDQTKRKSWASLAANLSLAFNARTIGGAVVADNMDFILADATAGAFTISLPAVADAEGYTVVIKKIDNTTNNITVDAGAGYAIDGSQTAIIINQWDAIRIWCDGKSWYIH